MLLYTKYEISKPFGFVQEDFENYLLKPIFSTHDLLMQVSWTISTTLVENHVLVKMLRHDRRRWSTHTYRSLLFTTSTMLRWAQNMKANLWYYSFYNINNRTVILLTSLKFMWHQLELILSFYTNVSV